MRVSMIALIIQQSSLAVVLDLGRNCHSHGTGSFWFDLRKWPHILPGFRYGNGQHMASLDSVSSGGFPADLPWLHINSSSGLAWS
jgi:hypothetical protein